MEDITFVVHREWLENIKGLPVEQQDKIIAEIVRYGVELESQHKDDMMTQALVNMVKGRINFSKDKYEQKVEMSKTAGRKKTVDNNAIREYIGMGLTAAQIAERMGCSTSSINHSEAWRNRKNEPKLAKIEDENFAKEDENIVYSSDFSF